MNDTIKLNDRKQEILRTCIYARAPLSSSEISKRISADVSLVTVKRDIRELFDAAFLVKEGAGAYTRYSISTLGRINTVVDIERYAEIETDERFSENYYNFGFIGQYPNTVFTQGEIAQLSNAHQAYLDNTQHVSDTVHKKELERFVIEMSWKSARIEGNTYTLLDTERLLRSGIRSEKNTDEEATMILNHKEAFAYILENKDTYTSNLSLAKIQDVHKILVKDLEISSQPRNGRMGITGSNYLPLDMSTQIVEAIEDLCTKIDGLATAHDKALLSLVGLSYIQAFEDGNKRIARFIANAVLLAHGYVPLSYRSVGEKYYREAMLVFYETQSLVAVKGIFMEQILFSSKNYSL